MSPVSRSDANNSYPATFVQADTSFKQVVQLLRGLTETSHLTFCPGPTASPDPRKNRSASNLYDRRSSGTLNSFNFSLLPVVFRIVHGLIAPARHAGGPFPSMLPHNHSDDLLPTHTPLLPQASVVGRPCFNNSYTVAMPSHNPYADVASLPRLTPAATTTPPLTAMDVVYHHNSKTPRKNTTG